VLYDLMHPQQQQQQQVTNTTGPLQQLDVNQQPSTTAAHHGRGGSSRAGPLQTAGQSSITGYVTRQPRQQQQQPDAKEQWRALFKLPKQPLGAHSSVQQNTSAEPRQARLGAQGQLVPAPQQQPPSAVVAAAGAPLSALPQAPGPSLPRYYLVGGCCGCVELKPAHQRMWQCGYRRAPAVRPCM
jgi:hypothetical protein